MAFLIASKNPKIPQDRAFTRRAIVYTDADRDLVVNAIRRAEPGLIVRIGLCADMADRGATRIG